MFVDLGRHESVRRRDVVGIFDLDKMPTSGATKALLKAAETSKTLVSLAGGLPRSFVLADGEYREAVYLTPVSAETLRRRIAEPPCGPTAKE